MKKTIFKTLAAVIGCTTLFLTGCLNNFDGTTPKYEEYSENYTSKYGENNVASGIGAGSIYASISSTTAAQDTKVTVTFHYCASELDQESVEAALTFYKLKPNGTNSYYYPEHDGELTKTFVRKEEPSSYSGSSYNSTVEYIYNVNTEDLEYSKIALVIDGSKLKYTNGTAVLSNDNNLTAGELTDSVVKYINMSYKSTKKGGGLLTSISNYFSERYDVKYIMGLQIDASYNPQTQPNLSYQTTQPSGTGKSRYWVRPPAKEFNADFTVKSYVDNLSDILSKMYKLQIQKPGSTEWEASGTLTFTYHSTASSAAADPYSANTYTTDIDTSAMEKGTKWRVLRDDSISLGTAPAWIKAAYGHEPMSYTPNRSIIERTGSIAYGSADTAYIFEWDGAGSFSGASDCTYANAQAAQSSMFNCTYDSSSMILEPVSGVELKDVNGFILVSSAENAIMESTTAYYYDENDVINKIRVKPKDESFIGYVKVYVNDKTTIKSGTNTSHDKQLNFGCYPDATQGELSGYVEIGEGHIIQGLPLITDTTASTSRVDYTLAYVNRNKGENIEEVFDVYLLPGTYYIEKANRYTDPNSILNGITERVYYGQLEIINGKTNTTTFTSYYYYSNSGSFTISVANAGHYKVRCYSYNSTTSNDTNHYYDGYMAFHIYKD